jgi:hypothetical protein
MPRQRARAAVGNSWPITVVPAALDVVGADGSAVVEIGRQGP